MDFRDLYSTTLPVVATVHLIMGISLLLIYRKGGIKKMKYRAGIRFMGIAMLVISAINYLEQLFPTSFQNHRDTLSITIFAASIQLFLLLYAYFALLDSRRITLRNIGFEIGCICLCTVPPIIVSSTKYPNIFEILFYIALVFYLLKYTINIYIYLKLYRKKQIDLQNYYSDDEKELLSWVHRTFYIVALVGAISIIVPLTNYVVLTFYQVFLLIAYFYIYWEIIHHELIFNDIILMSNVANTPPSIEDNYNNNDSLPLQAFLKWIEKRHYAKSGITIDDVAMQLKTNRNSLSIYINSELKMNFYEWISKLRIEDAQKILVENPGLPIAEVGIYVGIEDRSNFDKQFKRITGLSPSNYRIQQAMKKLMKKD